MYYFNVITFCDHFLELKIKKYAGENLEDFREKFADPLFAATRL